MTAWEIRGPFSTKKDERGILMRLVDLRKSWSERREQPDYLKYPEELGKDENTVIDILEYIRIQYPRNVYFPEWMKRQTIEDAVAIAKSQDAHTQVAELFRPVHTSVSLLTQMASDKGLTGLRGFVRNLAYFLRRSCISRPCNERLERILKTALENDCFPYADGVYLGDPDIHKKCKTAAEE